MNTINEYENTTLSTYEIDNGIIDTTKQKWEIRLTNNPENIIGMYKILITRIN